MKKTLVMMMVITMLVSALAGCAQQAESPLTKQPTETPMPKPEATPDPTPVPEPEQPFKYEDNGDGTCKITGYEGEQSGDLNIPGQIDGLTVTSIGQAFKECEGFTGTLSIPDSVTNIEGSAFYKCSGLTGRLVIPDSVTSIGTHTFQACGFTEVVISNSMTKIENHTFQSCKNLVNVVIPDSVTAIGNFAFSSNAFTEVTIPESVTSVAAAAFFSCKVLMQAEFLGDASEDFSGTAFSECADGFKIIYDPAKSGWSTPEWNGYPCYPKE